MPRLPRLRPARLGVLLGLCVLAGCEAPGRTPETTPAAPDTTVRTTAPADAVVGETIYVPVYSHIFHQDGTRELDLTATLSIRNTDPERGLTITAVGYYDSAGRLVRTYVEQPIPLGPLGSEAFVVEEQDRTGGVGANFLVEWIAEAAVSAPIVEAVMISTAQAQGVSLVSRGQVVRTLGETQP